MIAPHSPFRVGDGSAAATALLLAAALLLPATAGAAGAAAAPTAEVPVWLWWMAVGAAVVVGALIVYNIVYYRRDWSARQLALRRTEQLAQVLRVSHVRIWTYDVERQSFERISSDGSDNDDDKMAQVLTFNNLELGQRFHIDEVERLYDALAQMAAGQHEQMTIELHVHDDEDPTGLDRDHQLVLSVLRREQGRPTMLLGVLADVTDVHRRQREARERLLRYQTVFETAMVDMVYFNEQGLVSRMNQRAQHTFHLTEHDAKERRISLDNLLGGGQGDNGAYLKHPDYYHATQQYRRADGSRFYYELQLVPVRRSDGQLLGVYGTGRDISEVAQTYQSLQQGIKHVQQTSRELSDYVDNINYVLAVGGVRIATYSPHTHTLVVMRGLGDVQLSLTQSRCMTLVDDSSKRRAINTLDSLDNLTTEAVEAELLTTLRTRQDGAAPGATQPLWVQLHFVPVYDAQGRVDYYFGLCRDVSDVKRTEQLLALETERAQEVETLKNAFLRNMSYEIRTPLNAVVGFAELFEHEHEAEDEPVFIDQIKDNSAFLLRLINDILFLSRLDAHMIELKPQPTDFARTFEAHCYTAWTAHQQPGVRYTVSCPYERFVAVIDDTNLGRVIEQVVTNAAEHTQQGTVRARFDYVADHLLVGISDTGEGIGAEALTHIYDRFSTGTVHGTGLGLPICKELMEQMGGTIDITSEPGKGTTVWLKLPCEVLDMEQKTT